ncbi:isoprenyl transferase [Arcanobacterium ihumii]|uniref:isoprenyl transferase n=1 Tax=Arcanobacterium ihumii TaxID=2138162 RepID=UPI000F533721|nr:isoprenyl transferase [Arcanobacterium ihumii]
MRIPNFLYALYERSLRNRLPATQVPHHVGIILDGNRRWAKALGVAASSGHRRGADHVSEVLGWCEETGIGIVTLWMLSTDNLTRAKDELNELLDIIVGLVESLAETKRWKLRVIGDMSLLPSDAAARILHAAERSAEVEGMTVNVAIGYGGRQEIMQAMRDYLLECEANGVTLGEVADSLTTADITNHMYTRGQPDPDLIIRTSGEQRMSGFMLWQTVHTEFFFCETYWPDFRRTDFLRALRDYSQRERRRGK